MTPSVDWLEALTTVLREDGDQAAWSLLRTMFPRARQVEVSLLVGDMDAIEALAYAQMLFELGREDDADEVLWATIAAISGVGALGAQTIRDVPLGAQAIGDA
jgi:hypothetical protein